MSKNEGNTAGVSEQEAESDMDVLELHGEPDTSKDSIDTAAERELDRTMTQDDPFSEPSDTSMLTSTMEETAPELFDSPYGDSDDNKAGSDDGGHKGTNRKGQTQTQPAPKQPPTSNNNNNNQQQQQPTTSEVSDRRTRQRTKTDYLELSGQSQAQRKRTKKKKTTEQQTNLELQQQIDQLKTESDQQKQQIWDLKRDKKQAKDENTNLKAKINELEKQASALKAQQKKSQEEIKNLKDTNNRATENQTEQTTTQNNIITRLEKDIEELQNTIQDLRDTQTENETTINNLRCDLEEATQQQQQPQEEQDEIRTLKQKLKEAEEMTELLFHKLDEQTDRDEDTLTIETTTKPKCLLIADSNRREIIPYLDHDLAIWHHENEIFTIEQLEKWTNNEDLPKDYDHIIISQGTNDIRYGKDGYRMAKRMASTINQLEKDLPQTTISVLDLPPLKNNENNKEISLYNFTLAREKTTITISKKMRDEDTRDILRGDGIHLTPRGGEIAAREINKLVANNNNNNNNPKQQTTKVTANIPIPIPETTAESWYIPKKTGSTIIGKCGANIRKLQEKHSVSVHLHDQEKDSDEQRITVKGRQQNVNNARDEIEQIVYNYGRPQQQQKTKVRKDTECRYYNQGYCKMGNKCDFAGKYHIEFGEEKSNVMKIGRSKNNPEFTLGDMNLKYTDKYKYLGYIQNNKNNLEDHIKALKGKVENAYQTLLAIAGNKNFNNIEMQTIWELTQSCIESTIAYSNEIWNPGKTEQEKINRIMDNIIKRILMVPQSTPREALYIETGLLDPEAIRLKNRVLMEHRITNGNSQRMKKLITNNTTTSKWAEETKKAKEQLEIDERETRCL